MFTRSAIRSLALATCLAGCSPAGVQDALQSMTWSFVVDREVAAGAVVELQTLVHPAGVRLRGVTARLTGILEAPGAEAPPAALRIVVLARDRDDRPIERLRKRFAIAPDGSFSRTARLARDLPAGSTQTLSVEPLGGGIPRGTRVHLCLDLAASEATLEDLPQCAATPPETPKPPVAEAETAIVQVLDGGFSPPARRVSVGDTVRWILVGSDPRHTVTGDAPDTFDSGFVFRLPGDSFDVTFEEKSAGRAFPYRCLTHPQERGIVRVGQQPPDTEDE